MESINNNSYNKLQYGSSLFEPSKKLFQYHIVNYINNALDICTRLLFYNRYLLVIYHDDTR
jgi:hypothetical protein